MSAMTPVTKPKTDVGIIVGRFQTPQLHKPHMDLIQIVLNNHTRVIIFLGLSPFKGTYNNTLDFKAREGMIKRTFPTVEVRYIDDERDNSSWSKNLDRLIEKAIGPNHTVTLYGGRDSFLKKYSGHFEGVELESEVIISATEIRKQTGLISHSSPEWCGGAIWVTQNQWPKVVPTVDIAILNEDGKKVLLGRKEKEKEFRFIGGYADPNKDVSYEMAAQREAREETGLEIGKPIYIGSFRIPDWRYEGEVDKIITSFFISKMIYGAAKAKDDIAEVKWFEIDKVIPSEDIVFEHRGLWMMFLDALKPSQLLSIQD